MSPTSEPRLVPSAADPVLLRSGMCGRGHPIQYKSDLTECRDGLHCRRCHADAEAESALVRGSRGK